jgi:hypothetical protein
MIPVGPTRGDKDGSWRGGAFLVGAWSIFLVFGLFTPMPTFVLSEGFWRSFLIVWAVIGVVMSFPYAWEFHKAQLKASSNKKGPILFETRDTNGILQTVYHPEGPGGSSPPLNKGIARNLDTRWTIWREFTWVAPVTFGDMLLTWAWNLVFMGSRARRPGGDGAAVQSPGRQDEV